jgi:release factor glutamine methyltransferase
LRRKGSNGWGAMREYSETIPIQYEEGKTRFLGMDMAVDRRVLIPRPETELLVEVAAEFCRDMSGRKPFILDLCTGSGAVSLALERILGTCRVIGSDISEDAIDVARENLKRFGKEDVIDLVVSDMFSAFGPEYEGAFDCIVSNPPYVSEKDYEKLDAWVRAEPKIALYAGKEGMDYLEVIAGHSRRFLRPGGFVAVEIGYDQADKVKSALAMNGFAGIESFKDTGGHERVIAGWKNG